MGVEEDAIVVSLLRTSLSVDILQPCCDECRLVPGLGFPDLLAPLLGSLVQRVPHGAAAIRDEVHPDVRFTRARLAVLQALARRPVLGALQKDPGHLGVLAVVVVLERHRWPLVVLVKVGAVREPGRRDPHGDVRLGPVDLLQLVALDPVDPAVGSVQLSEVAMDHTDGYVVVSRSRPPSSSLDCSGLSIEGLPSVDVRAGSEGSPAVPMLLGVAEVLVSSPSVLGWHR